MRLWGGMGRGQAYPGIQRRLTQSPELIYRPLFRRHRHFEGWVETASVSAAAAAADGLAAAVAAIEGPDHRAAALPVEGGGAEPAGPRCDVH